MSSRLLVLYGRSGLGKTSLLRAGVYPLLRERQSLPLPVLLRQPAEKKSPLALCWEAVEQTVSDHNLEYKAGEKTGLWEFFKTAVFLKQADLQEPVLVFDQFEEIFDAYDRNARHALGRELGELLSRSEPNRIRDRRRRGDKLAYGEAPPNVRVVLSIREDHFGRLEEFSEYLPEIMHDRFRLEPLNREQAKQAVVGPAALEGDEYLTPPFSYASDALKPDFSTLTQKA